MTKILRMFPEISVADSIRAKLRNNLSAEKLEAEFRCFTDNEFT